LEGFLRYDRSNSAIAAFLLQGMQQISNTIARMGQRVIDILYQDILYKIEGNFITIIIIVVVK